MNYDISLIICTYNRHVNLTGLCNSVRAQKGINVEIIVCDDGSAPPAINPELVDQYYWRKDSNYHKVKCYNTGINLASSDKLLFMDDDCIPLDENWARTHTDCLDRACPHIALIL